MKYALATLGVAVGLIAAAPAQADPPGIESAFCRDAGACFVAVTNTNVDLGAIRTNRSTTAVWSLRCSQGSHRSVQRGTALPGETTFVEPELSNRCTLRARGSSDSVARVRVALR